MAVNYRIDPEERIVYLTTSGESSLSEWTEVMLAVLADPSYQPGFNWFSREFDDAGVVLLPQFTE